MNQEEIKGISAAIVGIAVLLIRKKYMPYSRFILDKNAMTIMAMSHIFLPLSIFVPATLLFLGRISLLSCTSIAILSIIVFMLVRKYLSINYALQINSVRNVFLIIYWIFVFFLSIAVYLANMN